MPGIRTFIALPAPSNAREAISRIQSTLKAAPAVVKWEPRDKFHITLKFLGTLEPSKLELLSTALGPSIQQCSSFTMAYESVGVFPNMHSPRVVWIGIKTNQAVLDVQANVERICTEFGFPEEDHMFHPHITLGRIKEPRNLGRLTEAIKTITFEPIETVCSEIYLMRSELHPGGSVYTILKTFPLHT